MGNFHANLAHLSSTCTTFFISFTSLSVSITARVTATSSFIYNRVPTDIWTVAKRLDISYSSAASTE